MRMRLAPTFSSTVSYSRGCNLCKYEFTKNCYWSTFLMPYSLEHHARFTRRTVQCCYSASNYANLCLVIVRLSCSLVNCATDLHQVNSIFLSIGSETLCTDFAAFRVNCLFGSKQRPFRLCGFFSNADV